MAGVPPKRALKRSTGRERPRVIENCCWKLYRRKAPTAFPRADGFGRSRSSSTTKSNARGAPMPQWFRSDPNLHPNSAFLNDPPGGGGGFSRRRLKRLLAGPLRVIYPLPPPTPSSEGRKGGGVRGLEKGVPLGCPSSNRFIRMTNTITHIISYV